MNDDLCFLSILEASVLIRNRQLSPVELTEAYLSRIEAFQPQLDAFITVTGESARRQAKRAEEEIFNREYKGPLHGIPVGLKDIYDTAGVLTSGNSKIDASRVPYVDATCWRKLRDGGAVLLGKLATHEFAYGGPAFDLPWPPARNPWNLERFTGGSSSGSGAATAAGLVGAAIGSDTGGSLRIPAAMCGVVGMMATAGMVSRAGAVPNSYTFDRCGPMARTVQDCALVLQQIIGFDAHDAGSIRMQIPDYLSEIKQSVKGMRIGVLRHVWEEDVASPAEVSRAMEDAIACFKELGVTIQETRVRPALEYNDVKVVIGESEIFAVHHSDLIVRPGAFCDDMLTRMLPAVLFQAVDYVQASRTQRHMIQELAPLGERFDALLTTVTGPAPRFDSYDPLTFWKKPHACAMANVLGGPAIGLPNGFTNEGMPIGMQLMGFPFQEAKVLRLASAYQQMTDWHNRRPPLTRGVRPPVVVSHERETSIADLSPATVDLVCSLANRAKLVLNDRQIEMLLCAAPYALAMADRVRRGHERSLQPANVFVITRNEASDTF